MNYKYLRLNTGEHVISVVEPIKANQEVKLIMPMIADIVPSMLGQGTIMKLSPLIPYTNEDHIIMRLSDISYFSSITNQFIDFYKKGVDDWVQIRDKVGLQVRTPKEELEEGRAFKNLMEQTVRQYVDNEMGDIRFEDEIQDELQDFNIDPNKDRTIH
tara:strand:+ start:138 stop:611 length:474 start_codon:yes stop_codon:yes gene_type:complete